MTVDKLTAMRLTSMKLTAAKLTKVDKIKFTAYNHIGRAVTSSNLTGSSNVDNITVAVSIQLV